ncbi:MAG: CehA/McbA family metallohydrolase [Anaerolineae bacterium]|nr:CehA/McbA family metallohydrolase [Caldilineales bacterium]MDW8267947.1 CehA/McbA family metallohydrolase [Anaerolineae bacterium]
MSLASSQPDTGPEYVGNLHMHTTASDGTGRPEELIAAARRAGLDFIIITDHNFLPDLAAEGWRDGVLTLFGSEINDDNLVPEANHCLTLGVAEDMTPFAPDPQGLIDAVRARGGLTFFAHPIEKASRLIPQTYPWTAWDVEGFTGIELWNFMSEFRPHVTSKLKALLVGYLPWWFSQGPEPETLAKWDELLQSRPTVAIGGSDAHAQTYRLGPFRRRFLPYDYCFRAVNTHILTTTPFRRQVEHDRELVYEALAAGRCWIGYDMAGSTRGFRFTAAVDGRVFGMGSVLPAGRAATFQVTLPAPAHIRLIRAGRGVVAEGLGRSLTHTTAEPGAYRVEAWKRWRGRPRGWVFSNPIYLVA